MYYYFSVRRVDEPHVEEEPQGIETIAITYGKDPHMVLSKVIEIAQDVLSNPRTVRLEFSTDGHTDADASSVAATANAILSDAIGEKMVAVRNGHTIALYQKSGLIQSHPLMALRDPDLRSAMLSDTFQGGNTNAIFALTEDELAAHLDRLAEVFKQKPRLIGAANELYLNAVLRQFELSLNDRLTTEQECTSFRLGEKRSEIKTFLRRAMNDHAPVHSNGGQIVIGEELDERFEFDSAVLYGDTRKKAIVLFDATFVGSNSQHSIDDRLQEKRRRNSQFSEEQLNAPSRKQTSFMNVVTHAHTSAPVDNTADMLICRQNGVVGVIVDAAQDTLRYGDESQSVPRFLNAYKQHAERLSRQRKKEFLPVKELQAVLQS